MEIAGYPATLTSWSRAAVHNTVPSRATITRLVAGATLGAPGDEAQQLRVLEATLALLEQEAPVEPVVLDERAPE